MERKNTVDIDFATSYNTKLQCIKVDSTRWGDVYMAIIPGTILGMIFEQYREALFENNTSTFYHYKRTGNIEKEILKTIRKKPDLFFSCNNGLSTIASEVDIFTVEGILHITRINNWKIINGATTTAAIAAASLNNKKVDLNKVFVPLKIYVIHNSEQEESIVFDILNSSNRQVKPSPQDFTSFSSCSLIGEASEGELISKISKVDIKDSNQDEKLLLEARKEAKEKRKAAQKEKFKSLSPEEREKFLEERELQKRLKLSNRRVLNDGLNLSDHYFLAAEAEGEESFDGCTFSPRVDENRGVSQDTPKANDEAYDLVYSSVFSPAEVKRKSNMLIQVYLHLPEETEKVIKLAQEAQKNAERRDYIPLQCKLKSWDKVDISLNIYGEKLLHSEKKRVIWFGGFTKCTFSYYVPKDIEDEELRCVAVLSINGAPIGEMCFVTQIVEAPRSFHPEVYTRKYNKIFISYAHQDESKVKFMAQAFKALGVDYFFDRDYLKAGDIFPLEIEKYINSADLFILCWSENAANSDYVQKERNQALDRAYPKVKPYEKAPLSICPLSIEPRAELPEDMKCVYNFEQI